MELSALSAISSFLQLSLELAFSQVSVFFPFSYCWSLLLAGVTVFFSF
jgi:hypothetical protein